MIDILFLCMAWVMYVVVESPGTHPCTGRLLRCHYWLAYYKLGVRSSPCTLCCFLGCHLTLRFCCFFLLLLQYPLPFSSVWFCQHRRNRGVPGSEQSWWKQPKRKKFDPTAVGKAVTQALAWAPSPTGPHDRGTQACPRERTPFEVNQADKVFTTLPAQRQWPVTALHCCCYRPKASPPP